MRADLVTMAGNVAQVFLTDTEWMSELVAADARCSDGATLVSDSTLRSRDRAEIAESLRLARFRPRKVRDAPDRPGLEFVFIAQRHGSPAGSSLER